MLTFLPDAGSEASVALSEAVAAKLRAIRAANRWMRTFMLKTPVRSCCGFGVVDGLSSPGLFCDQAFSNGTSFRLSGLTRRGPCMNERIAVNGLARHGLLAAAAPRLRFRNAVRLGGFSGDVPVNSVCSEGCE